jgi:hypothetical protein
LYFLRMLVWSSRKPFQTINSLRIFAEEVD